MAAEKITYGFTRSMYLREMVKAELRRVLPDRPIGACLRNFSVTARAKERWDCYGEIALTRAEARAMTRAGIELTRITRAGGSRTRPGAEYKPRNKKRACMQCGKSFRSRSPVNRICPSCRAKALRRRTPPRAAGGGARVAAH